MAPGVLQLPAEGQPWDLALFGELDLVIGDARSRTGAGMMTDNFPVEAQLLIKLRAGGRQEQAVPRWDFKSATAEAKEAYDMACGPGHPGGGGCRLGRTSLARVEEHTAQSEAAEATLNPGAHPGADDSQEGTCGPGSDQRRPRAE